MITTVLATGTLIGPNIGGIVVDYLSWRWTFGLNIPLGLLICGLGALLLPRSERRRSGPMDLAGIGLLTVAVSSLIYAFTELASRDGGSNVVVVLTCLTVAVGAGVAFIRRERRAAKPIVDIDLLSRREFLPTNALNFLYGVILIGLFSFIPLYLLEVYGVSASESGLLLTRRAIAQLAGASIAAMFMVRLGYRLPIAFGLALIGSSALVLALGLHNPGLFGLRLSDFIFVAGVMAVQGFAFGIVSPALNNAAIELAPDWIAAISGLRGMFRSTGGTIGAALVVLISAQAASTGVGLRVAFLLVGIVTLAMTLLVFGIRDPQRKGRQAGISPVTLPGERAAR